MIICVLHKKTAGKAVLVCRKTYITFKNGVWGVAPSGVRAAAPHSAPFPGKGVFGKDAEIRTHQALHEAKPSECPNGDRD